MLSNNTCVSTDRHNLRWLLGLVAHRSLDRCQPPFPHYSESQGTLFLSRGLKPAINSIGRDSNPLHSIRRTCLRLDNGPVPRLLAVTTNTPSRFLRPLGLRVHDIGSDRQMKIISHAITATDTTATAISEKTMCTAPPPLSKIKTRHRQTGPLKARSLESLRRDDSTG